ncbi:pyridoxal phosphate-dependent decarboxylase family protein [Leifsonia sp. 21MFCrub1.1]|uniref:pyridoxal phosphate-dependent decarboxylase family protein n=1 Tax=Leifsonia sp. 21MFCrub1.1 TaxID=1798223 RepID=UPI0008929AB8|nr:aminotransferase class V-fold PLP-dependent enzyme [Leifsonia sp. 21MFCrub1.1]SEA98885.1 Glutamate or tyrosine decarboxylase [Leifsonia sp. 21MFCrub1.1]
MSDPEGFREPLDEAVRSAERWLEGVRGGRIPPEADVEQVKDALGRALPDRGPAPVEVIRRMSAAIEPGLMRIHSPRFHGWVMGGAQPVALAADWLTSAWDQNNGLRSVTPGVAGAEELAAEWLLDLLGLPETAEVGFVTGATVANVVGLTCGRDELLRRGGWDPGDGLAGSPRIRVLVGAERHGSVDSAAHLAGLGHARVIAADAQGRMLPDALREALADGDGPALVVLQAGNIHSGAFDRFPELIRIAHGAGTWVHVDGAFGLWAAAAPGLRALTDGIDGADSWATDAHKTLSVPYDCGIAVVADPAALHGAMAQHAAYLASSADVADPSDRVPELSRRARGLTTYATLAQLGRLGVADLVQQLADAAAVIAEGIRGIPGAEVLNQVVYTQVCASFGSDDRTRAVGAALLADGAALASPSTWQGRAVLRFSVSNWLTDTEEAGRTVAAVRRAVDAVG